MMSDVEIASAALVDLGSEPFHSFDDAESRPDVKIVNVKWPIVYRDILSRYGWTFARTRAILTEKATKPLFGWDHQFNLPPDRVRGGDIQFWLDPGMKERQLNEFEIENSLLLCNEPTIYCRYVFPQNTGEWPPYVDTLAVMALAAAAALAVTDAAGRASDLFQQAYGTPSEGMRGGLFGDAMTLDAQQNPPEEFQDFSLTGVRY